MLNNTTIQNFYRKSFSELSSNEKEKIAMNFAGKNNLDETLAYEILFELNPVFIFKHLNNTKDMHVELLTILN